MGICVCVCIGVHTGRVCACVCPNTTLGRRRKLICLSIYSAFLCSTMQQRPLNKEASLWDSNEGERRGAVESVVQVEWKGGGGVVK